MANRCPSCGGTLQFDVATQKLVCPYCGSSYDPAEIEGMQGANEQSGEDVYGPGAETAEGGTDTEDVTIFTCRNCGGEISSTSTDAAEYCPYCGTFTTFTSRIEKLRKPEYIAAFKVTKEQAEGNFRHRLKSRIFAPGDLKRGGKGTDFNPMFIPFWDYEVTYPFRSNLITEESWREGNYDCTQEYYIGFDAAGAVKNCLYDASQTLDDRISDSIADYDARGLEPYNPSYMMGAYADMADVAPETYSAEAKERADEPLGNAVKTEIMNSGMGHFFRHPKSLVLKGQSGTKAYVKPHLAMLPTWFMTYRTRDRVAYSVVNGQTGSVFTEVPVSLMKYILFSIILAVPIFLLFELFLTVKPTTMLVIVAGLTMLIMIMYAVSASKEAAINSHANDKGYNAGAGGDPQKAASVSRKKKVSGCSIIFVAIIFVVAFFFVAPGALAIFDVIPFSLIFAVIAFIALLVGFVKADGKGAYFRDTIGGVVALIIAVIFSFYDPVDDNFYYFAAVAAMAGMVLSVIGAASRFNRRVSHPIPHFFDLRKGATLK